MNLNFAELNIDNGNIMVKILDRECGLRFSAWGYVLAEKSAGKPIAELAEQLKGMSMEALTHICFGAACNWCEVNSMEPWFAPAHISDFLFEDGPQTWAIVSAFCDKFNADHQGGSALFTNPN